MLHWAIKSSVLVHGSLVVLMAYYRNLRYIFRFQATTLLTYERGRIMPDSRRFARSYMPVLDPCSMY